MKKKAVKIIAVIVAVVIAAGGICAYAFLPHSLNYDINSVKYIGSGIEVLRSNEDDVVIRETSPDFKVMMFTDLHLDGKNKTSNVTVTNLVNNIVKEKPDLVILGGDSVTSALNRKRAHQLAEIFEKLGVYWAGVLGNHEGDNNFSISREEMMDIFTSYDHCLMKKGRDDVWGVCNYSLTVLRDNYYDKHLKARQTYFFMDTGDEMSQEDVKKYGLDPGKSHTDGVKESQVKWYKQRVQDIKTQYGDVKSTVVVHIPLPQYEKAAENGKFLYGGKLENVCESAFDSGLFEAIKECGSTKTVYCGHDHLNSFGAEYEGILLSYIQPSGYGSYTTASKLGYEEKDWLQGYTVLELHNDGTFDAKQIRNSEQK